MTNQINNFKLSLAPAFLHHVVRAFHSVCFVLWNYTGWFRCLWLTAKGGCLSP